MVDRRVVSCFALALLALSMTLSVPAYAATPALDCGSGGSSSCVATAGTIALTTVTVSGSLTVSNTGDLIIAIVSASSSSDTFVAPTYGGAAMLSKCTFTAATPYEYLYYYYPGTSGTAETVSETVTGLAGDSAGLVAFGINGVPSSSFFDGSCISNSGTSTTPSLAFTTTDTNDFVVAGVVANAGTGGTMSAIGATSPTSQIGSAAFNTLSTFGSSAGYQTGDGSSTSYTLSFSITESIGTPSWFEGGVAVKDATPSVPEFPYGILPLVLAVPVLYWFIGKGRKTSHPLPR